MRTSATRVRTFVVSWAVLFALAWAGCHHSSSTDAQAPGTGASGGAAGAPVSAETLRAICAEGPCAGPHAVLTVWRDAAGAVGRIVLQGDPGSCADAPTSYFDATGQKTEQIGLQPVVPGSPEAQGFADRQHRQLEGLTEAEHLSCPATN